MEKPLEKPLIPMVEMWKTIDNDGSIEKKPMEKPLSTMVPWRKPLTFHRAQKFTIAVVYVWSIACSQGHIFCQCQSYNDDENVVNTTVKHTPCTPFKYCNIKYEHCSLKSNGQNIKDAKKMFVYITSLAENYNYYWYIGTIFQFTIACSKTAMHWPKYAQNLQIYLETSKQLFYNYTDL